LNGKVRDAVISLVSLLSCSEFSLPFLFFLLIEQQHSSNQIDQEREGEQIDRALLKNVLDIFVEIGMGSMDYYENDFEAAMLKDTAAYYSRKASNWILEDSCPDYMLKVSILLMQPLNSAILTLLLLLSVLFLVKVHMLTYIIMSMFL